MRLFVLLIALSGCRVEWGATTASSGEGADATRGDVMVYTSAYPPVVAALEALAKEQLPGVRVRWFQAGSEKLAARLDAELLAGNPGADLLMASDPIYYDRLERAGALLPYASLRALRLPREYVDADGAYVACRLSAMGLVYVDEAPRRFSDLTDVAWRGRVTLPDPLGSGTMFSTVLALGDRFSAAALKANGATSSGGGTAVIDRLQRGEARVGVALVENALMSRSVRFAVPEEGAIVIPGQLAILKGTHQATAAKRVYDFILSDAAQRVFVAHHLHSPFADVSAPAGAPTLAELHAPVIDWPSYAERAEAVRTAWAKVFK